MDGAARVRGIKYENASFGKQKNEKQKTVETIQNVNIFINILPIYVLQMFDVFSCQSTVDYQNLQECAIKKILKWTYSVLPGHRPYIIHTIDRRFERFSNFLQNRPVAYLR